MREVTDSSSHGSYAVILISCTGYSSMLERAGGEELSWYNVPPQRDTNMHQLSFKNVNPIEYTVLYTNVQQYIPTYKCITTEFMSHPDVSDVDLYGFDQDHDHETAKGNSCQPPLNVPGHIRHYL